MLLNDLQKRHVRNVRTAADAFQHARRDAISRAKAIALEEIAGYQYALDREVRLAFEAGVPQRQIGLDGMNTSDAATVRASLKRTHATAELITETGEEATEVSERYSLTEDGLLRVTLTDDELALAKRAVNFDDKEATAPDSAVFELDARGRLACIDGDTIPNTYERNPVVFWAYENANETEALAWFASATQTEVAA